MQPVTIKNNQYSNTLWLSQVGLCLLAMLLLWMGMSNNPWLLVLFPFVLTVLYFNHKTITKQSRLQFAMRANGQLVVIDQNTPQSPAETNGYSSIDDEMMVDIKAFWHLPQLLMLKLSVKHLNRPVYLSLFRSVVGANDFSHLLVGLTQLNSSLEINHDH